jgi:hypothetical protein
MVFTSPKARNNEKPRGIYAAVGKFPWFGDRSCGIRGKASFFLARLLAICRGFGDLPIRR